MANNQNKRIRPSVLQEDVEAFAALQAITNYKPSNADCETAKVSVVKTSMESNQTAETQAVAAANAKRDSAMADEWNFQNMMLGVKDQIKAQFGANSNEFASLGLKKKSEYKTGRRKSTPGAGNNN